MSTVLIPDEFHQKLTKIAREKRTLVDELVSEILASWLKDMGKSSEVKPEEKVSYYLELNNKYFREGEDLLQKGDYIQASEKLWGAAAEMVKAVAAKREIEIKSHGELYGFVAKLRSELNDPQLTRLFGLAGTLHQNFYENWLPPEVVIDYAEAIKQFIAKLKRLVK